MDKPFVGEWVKCHNPECEVSFTRADLTHHHCSEECAAACLRRRLERPTLPALVMAPEVD